jgi:ribosome biogenesis GTPase
VGERSGRVVTVEPGVVVVVSRRRRMRASFGSTLLRQMAQDPEAVPRIGDRVQLRLWADGPVTVERVLARGVVPVVSPRDEAR